MLKSAKDFEKPVVTDERFLIGSIHPAWRALFRYCAELKHGEIERLKIQDGIPVLAEVTKKKIKFVI